MNSGAAQIATLIYSKNREISNGWFEALRQKWGESAEHKLHLLEIDQKEKQDLLSLLLESLPDTFEPEGQFLSPILHRVRMEDYSIFDFFLEISCLATSIEDVLRSSTEVDEAELLDGMRIVREQLANILGKVLKDTSEIYEHIAESGGRAFCQVDTQGRIIYANKELKGLLGLESVTEIQFESFFEGHEKDFVLNTIRGKHGEEVGVRRLQLKSGADQSIPVGAEIGPVFINGEHRGGYACMVDLSLQEKTNMEIFNKSPFGIIKVDTAERFTYANFKALEMFGMNEWGNKELKDVFPDDDNYMILKRQLEKRKMGLSDEYEIELTRLSDEKRIPVKISAIPETDLKGNVVGSLAIVRSMLLERTVEAIHNHVATIHDGQEILQEVAKEVEHIIPFARFSVSLYNPSMTHVRQLFSYYPTGQMEWIIRWWEIPDYMIGWLSKKESVTIDSIEALLDFFSDPELINRPEIRGFLEEGFKSFLRLPIIKKDRIVASVGLFSKEERAFNSSHVKLLEALPLSKAVLMAHYYEETKELKFRLNLIKEISSVDNNIEDVADVMVDRLAEHYDWKDVALFCVEEDEENQVIRLLSQKASSGAFRLPDNFEQSAEEGILGYAYRENRPVNVGNVHTDPEFKDIYKASLKSTVSELCLPIKVGEVFWLLNIEDSRQNAFSEEETEALMQLLNEVSGFLEKSWLSSFLRASLLYASDAVIVTSINGNIKRLNPATLKLFGYSHDEMIDQSLIDFFQDSDIGRYMVLAEKIPSEEVVFRRKDGEPINVILSGSQLQDPFTDKVFFATDLSLRDRLRELEHMGKLFNEIAIQTKTPLSLVFSWLRRINKEVTNTNLIDLIEKITRQLRKVELSFDRLALYDKKEGIIPYEEFLINISEVLDRVIDQFPKAEAKKVVIDKDKSIPYLRGDIFQLSFCLKTILSYLFRFLPEEERILLRVSAAPEQLILDISGFFPGPSDVKSSDIAMESQISQTLTEMALGEEILQTFIGNHKGYYKSSREGQKINFRIHLPSVTIGN